MKILFILPSIEMRGSQIIFDYIRGLTAIGNNVTVTSLDEFNKQIDGITPLKLEDARKESENMDIIIGYNPVCAFYVNDLETKARKYCLLLNDEREYYTKEYISIINKLNGVTLDREVTSQQYFINSSYELPLHYLVPNNDLEKELLNKKRKVSVIKTGISLENFYPDEFVPRTKKRIITDASNLPWESGEILSEALANLYDYELWTFGSGKLDIRVDKEWGKIDENMLRKLLSSSDIYINMSKIDGTATVSLKAMQSGCAVITRMTSGGKDIYEDKKNCLVLDENNLTTSLQVSTEELLINDSYRGSLIQNGLNTKIKTDFNKLQRILKKGGA